MRKFKAISKMTHHGFEKDGIFDIEVYTESSFPYSVNRKNGSADRFTEKDFKGYFTEIKEFKVGDKARCLSSDYSMIKKNTVEEISEIIGRDTGGDWIKFKNYGRSYRARDFEVVERPAVKVVYAKESWENRLTKGKAYEVVNESVNHGYRIRSCDQDKSPWFSKNRFTTEKPQSDLPFDISPFIPKTIHRDIMDATACAMKNFTFSNIPFNIPFNPSNFSRKPYEVVYVTHDLDIHKKPYIFEASAKIRIGDLLFANTCKGKSRVTAITNSFEITQDGLDALSIINNSHSPLQSITGRAVKTEIWEEVKL